METEIKPVPNMALADELFTLSTPKLAAEHSQAKVRLLEGIKRDSMAPLYLWLHSHPIYEQVVPWDDALYTEIAARSDEERDAVDKKLAEAEELNGEHDVLTALRERAELLAKIGDRDKALEAYQTAIERTATTGTKIDLTHGIVRLALFFSDWPLVKKNVAQAKTLVEEGGDWDRRNRFKVYNGIMQLYQREFAQASELLLDSMSTFSSTELLPYESLIKYAVIAGSISLSRVDMKNRIIDSPEVIAVLPSNKKLASIETFVNGLNLCDYAGFFKSLAQVEQDHLITSRILSPHCHYYVREMRRRAYAQILESYRALGLKSMADAFDVTTDFLDADLSRFIAEKKLNCVIDRVNGIIETNRPDDKNKQYQDLIKQGDMLLNKLQKYQAAISALK